MNEIMNTGEYISFAEELINKYGWEASAEKSLREQLSKIKEKDSDKELNLSIVGEFSVGKSTFINALLREELLMSNILQGTTAAATVIEYSPDFALTINFKNQTSQSFKYENSAELKNSINNYASENENAKDIDSVKVYYPSESLKKGFRIIDTPGTNATELWHEETTVRAIRELSDTSIILIDATKTLPETQKQFIRENLEGVLEQCIFVVTKIDLVRDKERQQVLEYLKKQISYEFGLESPCVIPFSSLLVLENALNESRETPRQDNTDNEKLLSLSYKNESELYERIAEQKLIAQTKKILLLMDDMYSGMKAQMLSISENYERAYQNLDQSKTQDLYAFLNNENQARLGAFYNIANARKQGVLIWANQFIIQNMHSIMNEIDVFQNIIMLNNFLQNIVSIRCKDIAFAVFSELGNIRRLISESASNQIAEFRSSFKGQYNLTLSPVCSPQNGPLTSPESQALSKVQQLASRISITVKKGSNSKASLINAKTDYKNRLAPLLNEFCSQMLALFNKTIDGLIYSSANDITTEINRCYAEYSNSLNKKAKEDSSNLSMMAKTSAIIKSDLESIDKRKDELISIRQKLKTSDRRHLGYHYDNND